MIKTKEIPEWFTLKYEVTPDGKIYSLNYCGVKGNKKELKQVRNSDGYKRISLYTGYRERVHFFVHRIIATLFVKNPDGKKFINHKNGIKSDNRVENLEWCDHSQNLLHAYKYGLRSSGKYKSKRIADLPPARNDYSNKYKNLKFNNMKGL